MTKAEVEQQIRSLPRGEQYEIGRDLWEQFAPEVDLRPTPELQAMLQSRLAAAKETPGRGRLAETVFADLRKKHGNA